MIQVKPYCIWTMNDIGYLAGFSYTYVDNLNELWCLNTPLKMKYTIQ